MSRVFSQLLLLTIMLAAGAVHAQRDEQKEDTAEGADATYEIGFHLGNLLPNQIDGVTEIIGMGGARGGFRLAPKSYCEFGLIMGNGEGVEWKNAHVDVRMDIPVENLVGVAYVGADAVMYKTTGGADKTVFGGHVGGGIQVPISGMVWFRTDMKFGFSPGTSLYIGAGLVFRMGESTPGSGT